MFKRFALCALSVLLVMLAAAGCAPSSESPAVYRDAAEGSGALNTPPPSSGPAPQMADEMASESFSPGEGAVPLAAQNRKIVRTASFSIASYHFDHEVTQIRLQVAALGGFFEQSDILDRGLDRPREASMIVRIPDRQMDAFLSFLRGIERIESESTRDTDMSETYVDTQLRVDILKQNLERLEELQRQSADLDIIFRLQREINDLLLQIESMTTDLRRIDARVDNATVTIAMRELLEEEEVVLVQEDTLWQSMAGAFERTVDGLSLVGRGLAIAAAALTPVFALLIAAFVLFLIVHRIIARRWLFGKKKKKAEDAVS